MEQARLLHGSQLIGLRVWGPDNQQLGTIKDFIVDYQGDCPTLFLAMAPEVQGIGEGYVIVPFTTMHVDFDTRARTNYFRFHVSLAQLRDAPRIDVNQWTSLNNRQHLVNAQQFYQKIERTAARPETGGATRPDSRSVPGDRQDPRLRQDQAPRPDTGKRPEAGDPSGRDTRPDASGRQDTDRTNDRGSPPDADSRPDRDRSYDTPPSDRRDSPPRPEGTSEKEQRQPPERQ